MTLFAKRIRPEKWRAIGVDKLEPNAMEVVQSTNNRSVIAGPGAGKTELLAQRATYLLQTGLAPAPRRILAISSSAMQLPISPLESVSGAMEVTPTDSTQ